MKKTLLLGILSAMALGATAEDVDYVMDLRNGDFSYNEDGSWVDTYNDEAYTIDVDIFSASHSSWYEGSYNGFLPCVSTSNVNQENFVANQWGCMAGGAVKVDAEGNVVTENGAVVAEAGAPYLMAYWMEFMESPNYHGNQILLSTDQVLYAKEMYVCTQPYAYYTLENGDSFSRAFTQKDDQFVLHIHGLDADFEDNGKVVDYVLANSIEDGEGGYKPNQKTDWQLVDLSSLGQIAGVYFTMESTDTGVYGMNTPGYFCIDRFTVSTKESTAVAAIEAAEESAPVYYTLQGVKVAADALTSGIYVKVANGKASKIQIR